MKLISIYESYDTMSLSHHSESNFSSSPRGAVGARLLKFSNRFTAYSIDPIELKLGMIILDINLHNRYMRVFGGAVEGQKIPKFFPDSFVHFFILFLFLAVVETPSSRSDR